MLDIWLPKSSAEEAMQKSNHWDAKLHLLECKVTPIMVQSYILWSAKLHLSECKVTPIMVQSYKHQDAIPNIFGFNLKYPPTITSLPYIKNQSSKTA